jgi:aminocarboxymuconate-semialdehyde decarboxylase
MVIDTHAHTLPPAMMEAIERNPERYDAHFEIDGDKRWLVMLGRRRGPIKPQWFDAERRLADMDETGIDLQVLSPFPPLLSYWAEAGWAGEIAALMNEGIAAMAAETDRFWGIGQLPLQSPEASLQEIDHVRQLGLLGVMIGANVEQTELDDEALEPVWARLNELQMTVFVHPINPTLIPRLEPYHLTNLIGNPLDTTIALSRLILSGVLIRHPNIRFYFAHAGGFIPYLYGRIDHAYNARDDTSSVINVLPSTLLKTVWFDTITHAEPPLHYLITSMTDTNVVIGTDYPADMSDPNILSKLTNLNLTPKTLTNIHHQNAERLFARTV